MDASDPSDADPRPALPDPWSVLRWSGQLAGELVRLPQSLAQWREGVAVFVDVARRMERVTTGAEQVLAQIEASGLPEQLERLNRLGLDLSRTLAGEGTMVGEPVLTETRRNMAALSRLFAAQEPPADRTD